MPWFARAKRLQKELPLELSLAVRPGGEWADFVSQRRLFPVGYGLTFHPAPWYRSLTPALRAFSVAAPVIGFTMIYGELELLAVSCEALKQGFVTTVL